MKKITSTIFAILVFAGVSAQKLPNVQQSSVKAPAIVKIDGKADEWGAFKAFNAATDAFYSLANSENRLYLIVQTANYNITNKVTRGGLTLTVNANAQKDGAPASSITFPLIEPAELRGIVQSMRDVMENSSAGDADALTLAANKKLAGGIKLIKASGLKNVSDSLISIYNEQGIKAAAALSQKGILTCEFEIPLTLLNLRGDQFSYNIKLNGPKLRPVQVPVYIPELEGNKAPVNVFKGQGVVAGKDMTRQQAEMVATTLSTDFSAEYKLAK
ncbi:hypothetical protein ACFQZS_00110 [Mucilaginibacter calamicampi]|uniref:Uncharacterized protein n=1 Tax=Mucilaginibacter calamicampi TaxID=1302352 RepID=A0ABW2YQ83_9SPHI